MIQKFFTLEVKTNGQKLYEFTDKTLSWIKDSKLKNGILNIQCGAGIVNDSIPELEWEETINKSKAILQAYKNLRKMK